MPVLPLRTRCRPWPCGRAFPASAYYGGSVPTRAHQLTTQLPGTDMAGRWEGQARAGSHVHCASIDGMGAQLCPCGIAMSTP